MNSTYYHLPDTPLEKIQEARLLLAESHCRPVPDCYAKGEKERRTYDGDMVPPRDRTTGLSPAFSRENFMKEVTTVDYAEDLVNPVKVYKPGELDCHGNPKPVGFWGALRRGTEGLKMWCRKRRLQKAARLATIAEAKVCRAIRESKRAARAYDKLVEELEQ